MATPLSALEASARLEVFCTVWTAFADVGLVDALHSMEWLRVVQEFCAADMPLANLGNFIVSRANATPEKPCIARAMLSRVDHRVKGG